MKAHMLVGRSATELGPLIGKPQTLHIFIWVFSQEDVSQEDAIIILLFEDINYKVKSAPKLLQGSRDLLYVLF